MAIVKFYFFSYPLLRFFDGHLSLSRMGSDSGDHSPRYNGTKSRSMSFATGIFPIIRGNLGKADRQTRWTAVEMPHTWLNSETIEHTPDFLFAEVSV
jgi:hypothetical protein